MAVKTRNEVVTEAVDEHGLSIDSLVGSYFHSYDDGLDPEYDVPTGQGRIVAEPQAGTYLVEFFTQLGQPDHQELVGLDRMLSQHWAFYDSQDRQQERYLNLSLSMRAA